MRAGAKLTKHNCKNTARFYNSIQCGSSTYIIVLCFQKWNFQYESVQAVDEKQDTSLLWPNVLAMNYLQLFVWLNTVSCALQPLVAAIFNYFRQTFWYFFHFASFTLLVFGTSFTLLHQCVYTQMQVKIQLMKHMDVWMDLQFTHCSLSALKFLDCESVTICSGHFPLTVSLYIKFDC